VGGGGGVVWWVWGWVSRTAGGGGFWGRGGASGRWGVKVGVVSVCGLRRTYE